ncbi:hypothetical protein GBAR_LOCUS3796, partial [Geodia barretti]
MRESIHALRCDLLCLQDTQSERSRSYPLCFVRRRNTREVRLRVT